MCRSGQIPFLISADVLFGAICYSVIRNLFCVWKCPHATEPAAKPKNLLGEEEKRDRERGVCVCSTLTSAIYFTESSLGFRTA